MKSGNKTRIVQFAVITMLALVIGGCSWLPKQIDVTKNWSAKRIYQTGKSQLNKGDYEAAIKYFEKLESRFPSGRYAQQAKLDIAYAYYKNEDFSQAIAACNRFIKLYPRHPSVDYAYYLKGLSNYRYKKGLFERIFPVDTSSRDPGANRQAFFDFKTLVQKFPNSKYARDAQQRMLYLRNNLAKHEIRVARYYYERGALVAAINRAKYVLENYNRSPSISDALEILYYGYTNLGMKDLASDAKRVLARNYPKHPVVTGKPPRKGSFFKRIFSRKKNIYKK